MEEDIYALEVKVSLKDTEASKRTAEDNAWEHAKDSTHTLDIDLGDDSFGVIFQELSKRYNHNVEHLQFFMMTAMLMVKTLEENKLMTIFTENKPLTAEEISMKISKVANIILDSYMWIAAGYELTWLHNDELPEQITVVFNFKEDEVNESEDSNG